MATTEWLSGGYFLMGPVHEGAVSDARLARPVWSISTCVSDSYPEETFLEWVTTAPERDEQIRKALDLSPGELAKLKADVTHRFDRGELRWPNVFVSTASAKDFHARWLTRLGDIRLLGISLRADDLLEYLDDSGSAGPNDGVVSLLRERRPPEPGKPVGFEVLGTEAGGFHTHHCHGLAGELMDVLEVGFGEEGLVTDWSGAEKVSDWINRDEVGAEPVPWYPWRIVDYPLK